MEGQFILIKKITLSMLNCPPSAAMHAYFCQRWVRWEQLTHYLEKVNCFLLTFTIYISKCAYSLLYHAFARDYGLFKTVIGCTKTYDSGFL